MATSLPLASLPVLARISIARAARTSPDLVRTLAADPAASVRRNVAKRRILPDDLLRALAADPEYFVRHRVAK